MIGWCTATESFNQHTTEISLSLSEGGSEKSSDPFYSQVKDSSCVGLSKSCTISPVDDTPASEAFLTRAAVSCTREGDGLIRQYIVAIIIQVEVRYA
jgi:hypothetical protein